jgi:glycerol-3-phosphate acyltransferase PlsY
MEIVFSILIGYLVGSISFSYIVAKKVAGIDIRQHGSKNAGATNTLRLLGKGPAIFVLFLDALKGILAVLIAMQLTDLPWVIMLSGLGAIVGHNWPVFFGFKGGKGVSTTIGVVFTVALVPAAIASLFAVITIFISRYVSLGSLVFATLLPIVIALYDLPSAYIGGTMAIMLLTYIRHRANIVRIIKGEENKLGKKPS